MKTLFYISSALSPSYGHFTFEERYSQTLQTIDSIRRKVPDSKILLADVSVKKFPDEKKEEIKKLVDYYIDLSEHSELMKLSVSQLKSHSETLMSMIVFKWIIDNLNDSECDRIFKITGRIILDDLFDIDEYVNLYGKYVFKKSVSTWMKVPYNNIDRLYDTRLYSLCSSLKNTHLQVLQNLWNDLRYVDLEHAIYGSIPKELVVEFERVHCKGRLASSGEWVVD